MWGIEGPSLDVDALQVGILATTGGYVNGIRAQEKLLILDTYIRETLAHGWCLKPRRAHAIRPGEHAGAQETGASALGGQRGGTGPEGDGQR